MTLYTVSNRRNRSDDMNAMCPVCCSVGREPCRKVLGRKPNGSLLLGAIAQRSHPERKKHGRKTAAEQRRAMDDSLKRLADKHRGANR